MPVITHITLDDNIHELVFTESSRRTIDHFLDMLVQFYGENTDDNLYFVLDMCESGMLPLRYLTKELGHVLEAYPEREAARIALVLDDPQMLNVTRALLDTIVRRDRVQYFTQIDKARLWLQLEQKKQGNQ